MVVFKFINCYVSLYYIAFLKDMLMSYNRWSRTERMIVGKEQAHSYLFGMPMTCVNDDCLVLNFQSRLCVKSICSYDKMQRCFSLFCCASSGLNDLGSQLAIFMIMRHQGSCSGTRTDRGCGLALCSTSLIGDFFWHSCV